MGVRWSGHDDEVDGRVVGQLLRRLVDRDPGEVKRGLIPARGRDVADGPEGEPGRLAHPGPVQLPEPGRIAEDPDPDVRGLGERTAEAAQPAVEKLLHHGMAKVPQRGADGAARAMRTDRHHRAAPVLPVGVQDRRRVLVTWQQRRPGPSDMEGPREALRQRMSGVLPDHPQLGLGQQRLHHHPEHRRRRAKVIGEVQPPLAGAYEIGQDGHSLERQGRPRGEDDIEPVRGGRQRRRALQLHVGDLREIAGQWLQGRVGGTHPEDPKHGMRDHADLIVPGPRPEAPAQVCRREDPSCQPTMRLARARIPPGAATNVREPVRRPGQW